MQLKTYFYPVIIILLYFGVVQNAVAQESLARKDSLSVTTDLASDSTQVKNDSIKSNAIDAPILYNAKDSMRMILKGKNMIYMYGEGDVTYKNLHLEAEYIELDAQDKVIYATYGLDSIGDEFGYPIFQMDGTQYEMKQVHYNYETEKSHLKGLITVQGEGYITAETTKKMPDDILYMKGGHYTTCDHYDNPHFYMQMTKAKLSKDRVVFGPAYLVVEDVPLPIALPFGFFPSTSEYSSGVIFPSYGDELTRGFSLRDGGYYFAFNDYVDLALTGEIFTKGSWGLDARSNYRKRYKFSGNLHASYRVTITGEDKSDADYKKQTDFLLRWSHAQDAKANPFSSFSANVNFSTSSYSRNDVTSIYSNDYTQNTKSSSINYSYRPPSGPFTFNMNASINQVSRDTTIGINFPNLTISMRDIYPFQRKELIGTPRWYENIRIGYSGVLSNSITAKEYEILHKNVIKDWKNAMKHEIPISASFNLFKKIALTVSGNYTERWYTSSVSQEYTYNNGSTVLTPQDTTYGFYRIFDYSMSVSANTKIYGMYKPWNLFGEWAKKTVIRHVITPSVSFSGAPDFGDEKYGYWKKLNYLDADGEVETTYYSPFQHHMYGVPGRGKRGNMSFSIDNNLEMKVPVAGTDSTKKISLIDQFRVSSGYNFLADSLNWNNITANLRLKFGTAYTLSLQGIFDVYTYDEKGRYVNKTRLESGKGLGRLRSTGTTFSYSLNTQTLKNLFSRKKKTSEAAVGEIESEGEIEEDIGIAVEDAVDSAKRGSLRKAKEEDDNYDEDGYYLTNIPWNLNFNYSLAVGYDTQKFNKEKREYPYAITQSLGISGSITPTKNWTFNFNTSYDFEDKKFTYMQCSIVRQMHCWQMSASVVPIGPYQSYNFTIAVSSALLQDLKYTQSSNSRDSKNWGY